MRRLTDDEFKNKIKSLHGNTVTPLKQYVNARSRMPFLCNVCDKSWETVSANVLGGIGCPNCYKSKGEDIVEQYLIDNNYNYQKQFKFQDCRNKRALPFDFAIFENGSLKFLIEYDGIQHFVPKFGIKSFESIQLTDSIKNKYCENNDINLIRIKYIRSQNTEIFKSKIISQLESKINMTIPSQA